MPNIGKLSSITLPSGFELELQGAHSTSGLVRVFFSSRFDFPQLNLKAFEEQYEPSNQQRHDWICIMYEM